MGDKTSNARGRELGGELYTVRRAKGWTMRQVADQAGWSESKVSRTEAGQTVISEQDVIVFLTICGVIGPEFDRIVALARRTGDSYWMRANTARMEQLRSLISLERTAKTVANYEVDLVPGLLQTEQYCRELYRRESPLDKGLTAVAVRTRLARQELLKRRNPPQFTFYINERAFRRRGLEAVMHEQVLHLVFAGSRPQCVIRIVPESAEPIGTTTSAFRLMTYRGAPTVVYLPTETVAVFLEGDPHVARYKAILEHLNQSSLTAQESRTWLADLASRSEQTEARLG